MYNFIKWHDQIRKIKNAASGLIHRGQRQKVKIEEDSVPSLGITEQVVTPSFSVEIDLMMMQETSLLNPLTTVWTT